MRVITIRLSESIAQIKINDSRLRCHSHVVMTTHVRQLRRVAGARSAQRMNMRNSNVYDEVANKGYWKYLNNEWLTLLGDGHLDGQIIILYR